MLKTTIAISALALALAGCGGDDKKDSPATGVSKTVDSLKQAAAKGDGAKICDSLFTESLRKRAESESKQSCADAVKTRLVPHLAAFTVTQVQIDPNGKSALAYVVDKLRASDRIYLSNDGGGWKVYGILVPGSGRFTPATKQ